MADGVISSRFSIVHSSKNSKMGLGCEPTEMYAIRAKFFTNPTAWPSGVSAGHIIPQWVLCSCRGRASLPSRPMGELRRRRWDKVDANVSLLSTCDTPARLWWAFFWSPQFPVAKEYLRPSVITFGLSASSMLKSYRMSGIFYSGMSLSYLKQASPCIVLHTHNKLVALAVKWASKFRTPTSMTLKNEHNGKNGTFPLSINFWAYILTSFIRFLNSLKKFQLKKVM